MPHPQETLWEQEPHTEAKHRILGRYLQAWFPIMLQAGFARLTYFEGFSGPGEYAGGEPGSPIIALSEFLRQDGVVARGAPVTFAFVEERQDRVEYLKAKVEGEFPNLPEHVRVVARRGRFDETMEPLLEEVHAWSAPVFANLDTWGADVPFPSVQRIGANPRSEVLVTLVSDFFRRFAGREALPHGDDQFGSQEWRRVAELPSAEKRPFLITQYRETLQRAGFPLTLAFELLDEQGHEIVLVFGTNSERAIQRMKDAMWRVDPVYGVRFRDPHDPAQVAFDMDKPDTSPLRRAILAELAGGARKRVEDLRKFTLLETIYRETHAMGVLRSLREERVVRQESPGRLTRESIVYLR